MKPVGGTVWCVLVDEEPGRSQWFVIITFWLIEPIGVTVLCVLGVELATDSGYFTNIVIIIVVERRWLVLLLLSLLLLSLLLL